MSGKFNPSKANRADFEYLFWLAKEGIPALELQMSRIQSELTSRINPLYDEVQTACGEYRNLGERLDAADDALDAEESARTAADTNHDAALASVIDGESKNLMPIANQRTSETKRGITAVYDPIAGTVTLTGTHDGTGDANFYCYIGNAADQKAIPAGEYHLSGVPAGGSTATYVLILTNLNAYDDGNGKDFTLNSAGTLAPYIRVRKPEGQDVTFDNVVFRPMVCAKSAYAISPKFVPYHPSVAEMYAMIKALQASSGTQAQLTSIRPVAGLTTDASAPEDTEVLDDA